MVFHIQMYLHKQSLLLKILPMPLPAIDRFRPIPDPFTTLLSQMYHIYNFKILPFLFFQHNLKLLFTFWGE